MALLFDILAALPDGARAAEVASSNWSLAAERAVVHGVAPYLWKQMRERGIRPPEDISAQLDRASRAGAVGALGVLASSKAVLEIMDSARIPVIVLKGWPLGERLYAKPELRVTGDVDVLVHPDDTLRAVSELRAAGGRFAIDEAMVPSRLRYH